MQVVNIQKKLLQTTSHDQDSQDCSSKSNRPQIDRTTYESLRSKSKTRKRFAISQHWPWGNYYWSRRWGWACTSSVCHPSRWCIFHTSKNSSLVATAFPSPHNKPSLWIRSTNSRWMNASRARASSTSTKCASSVNQRRSRKVREGTLPKPRPWNREESQRERESRGMEVPLG